MPTQRLEHMRKLVLLIACLGLIALLIGVGRLANEPHKYCRFLFGQDQPLEVIVACSGESLLLFRNGDVTTTPETYALVDGALADDVTIPEIVDNKGTRYAITSVSEHRDDGPPVRHAIMAYLVVDVGDNMSFRQYCQVALKSSLADADYCHFNGPLEIGPISEYNLIAPTTELVRGDSPKDLQALVGTFDEDGGCWTVLESGEGKFPDGVFPQVTVQFTTENSSTPTTRIYDLDKFCCGAIFYGPVWVPDDATGSTARLTLNFDRWTRRSVDSTTVDAPIIDTDTE